MSGDLLTQQYTHVKWKMGFGTVACSVSYGSRMSRKPFSYVATRVPNPATFWRAKCSSMFVNSSVRTNWVSLSAANLISAEGQRKAAWIADFNGRFSINVISFKCAKKD